MSAPDGLVIVDKPGGMTSHDVVAQVRRLAGTRRVGHAGTLDPMATGVLVVGVGKATRMLGYLALTEKQYAATIRLGQSTSSGDAEGEVTGTAPELAARPVTVHEFAVTAVRHHGDLTDADVTVRCSSGTYIRALARDLGAALGTGGHLTRLRRTSVGSYGIESARTLDQLADRFEVLPLARAAAAAFPRRDLTTDEARRLAHGGRVGPGPGRADAAAGPGQPGAAAAATPVAAYAPDGTLVALVAEEPGQARPLVVFAAG